VFYAGYASGSRQLVWAFVTDEMVSQYCFPSYISDELSISSMVSGIWWY